MNTLTNFPIVRKHKQHFFGKLELRSRYQQEELVLAVSQERQRLARELHDSVLQVFYGINMIACQDMTNRSRSRSVTEFQQTNTPMTSVSKLTETGINEVRALLCELRPDLLETEGLVTALGKRIALLRECYQLNVEAFLFGEPDCSAECKHALYCIAQEAFSNIIKHARASTVTLWLIQKEQSLVLVIRDDGRGFKPNTSFPGHFGLQSVRERVALLDGTLSIVSAPEQGTALCICLPIEN